MNPLLVAVLVLLVLLSIPAAFFFAVAMFYLGVLICDEIKLYMNEPRQTRAEKRIEDDAFEAFLEDLHRYHVERPLNVFRDGVQLV